MGKVFGPPEYKCSDNGNRGEAPEKKMNLGPLVTAETIVSLLGLKTMGGVPVHQEQSYSSNFHEVDYDNNMSDFSVVGCLVRRQPTNK